MFKRLSSTLLVITVFSLSLTPVYAASDNKKQVQFEAKVKEAVLKLGTGSAARIDLRLRDKTKIRGYIAEASDETFVVVDPISRATQVIPYAQVKQIKGHNLSTGAKIAIGVGITVGVIAVLALIFYDHIVAY